MVRLLPVRAYFPDPRVVDPSRVSSPVYDVMGEEELARYDAREHNAASFTSRPRASSVAQFVKDARENLDRALAAGAFRQDEKPSLYVYGIRYVPPQDVLETVPADHRRKEYMLLGVVGGLDLSAGRDQGVAKHERTFPGRVEERVQLTEATGMHFAPIMASYSIRDHAVNNLVEDTLGLDRRALALEGSRPPLVEANVDGATHRLWRIEDPEVVSQVQALLAPVRLMILDGHHRFTSSLERRASGRPDLPLTMLVEGTDRALLLLPWHRVLPDPGIPTAEITDRAARRFPSAQWEAGPSDGARALSLLGEVRRSGRRGFVIATGDGLMKVLGEASPNEGADYDLLQSFLEGDLGVRPEHLEFVRSPGVALGRIHEGNDAKGVAFLIPQLSVDGVERTVFELGTIMGQKTTMFLPKVAEGVIFAPADAR